MNKQQSVSHGLLYSVAPEHFAQLYISDDTFGDEFGWDESDSQYEDESPTGNLREFLQKFAAE